jgi:cupin superfamily acireductone dioxygenase involved in methionine salvage
MFTTGKMVLDLSSYKLTHEEQRLFFVDGKCTFTIYNNNNNIYEITVDKEGNVINSRKL